MAATRTLGVLTDGLIESRGDRQPHVTTLAATNSEHNQPPQRRVITRLDAAAFGKCKTSRGVVKFREISGTGYEGGFRGQ